ncbi:uncharacterized protein LOC143657026 [Tamandua tetradactyla]|uniref:uncharacterized protein LOC143657026 n=1 Tax=Tamandua tetradactyla TaxID=48850 RepID=UPI0040539E4D
MARQFLSHLLRVWLLLGQLPRQPVAEELDDKPLKLCGDDLLLALHAICGASSTIKRIAGVPEEQPLRAHPPAGNSSVGPSTSHWLARGCGPIGTADHAAPLELSLAVNAQHPQLPLEWQTASLTSAWGHFSYLPGRWTRDGKAAEALLLPLGSAGCRGAFGSRGKQPLSRQACWRPEILLSPINKDAETLNVMLEFIPNLPQELKATLFERQLSLRELQPSPREKEIPNTVAKLCCKVGCTKKALFIICAA